MTKMLAQLEKAIQELEARKEELLDNVQEECWTDDRANERIPERVESTWTHGFGTDTLIPEQSPLPSATGGAYQQWYSSARAILARNQPDRLKEFDGSYASVKQLLTSKYVTKSQEFKLLDKINAQFDILAAIPSHLQFSLYDIELEAYSILMDDELDAARHLLSKGFLRSAGVLAGVMLERHLKNILRKRTPPIKYRKNATLSSTNDLCKNAVYDLVTWRKVQHLTDLRNLCAHDRAREPTKEEVSELVGGVSAILKTHSA